MIFNVKACDSVVFNIQCESLRLCGFCRHEFGIVVFNVSWKACDFVVFNVSCKTFDSVVFNVL